MNKFDLLREQRKAKEAESNIENIINGVDHKITVEGVDGELDAKIDTGNDGYNVIHADDIQWEDHMVTFTINGTPFEKTVVETVEVTTSDNTTTRPIVLLNITFLDSDYIDVPFSLDDRSGMDQPVLIGEAFLNEIEQIIKLSKKAKPIG